MLVANRNRTARVAPPAHRSRPALEALDARDMPAFIGVGVGVCLPPVHLQATVQVGYTCAPVNDCTPPKGGGYDCSAPKDCGPGWGKGGNDYCGPRNWSGFDKCDFDKDVICIPKGEHGNPRGPKGDCAPPVSTCPPKQNDCDKGDKGGKGDKDKCDVNVKGIVGGALNLVGGILGKLSYGHKC